MHHLVYQPGLARERNTPEWFTNINRQDQALATSWGVGASQNGMSPDRHALLHIAAHASDTRLSLQVERTGGWPLGYASLRVVLPAGETRPLDLRPSSVQLST